jgi:hypothetical protein
MGRSYCGWLYYAGEWDCDVTSLCTSRCFPEHLPPGRRESFRRAIEDIRREHESRIDTESLSAIHGGFWENVLSVTVVDGLGQVHTMTAIMKIFLGFLLPLVNSVLLLKLV